MKQSLLVLGRIVRRMYTGTNLMWQVFMCVVTFILVMSGFDAWWFGVTRGTTLQMFLWPAVTVGGLLPIITPPIIFAIGWFRKNKTTMLLGLYIGLAAALAAGISSLYKVFTGRIPPGFHNGPLTITQILERSHGFQFGFYRGGAFNGWPSSHTATSFAIAWVIIAMYPEKKWLKWILLAYALYVGIGVSTNIHWFSEFIAGIILGSIVGTSIGGTLKLSTKIHSAVV